MDRGNPNHRDGKGGPNLYQIGGVPVEFPYKPYGSQLAFMGRVISTLDRARRQGHCHALLESPTGTGKSLSLLCSSLAWQQHQRRRTESAVDAEAAATVAPQPTPDPLVHGGGFIPEPETPGNGEQSRVATSARAQRRQFAPKIYYASRTHSQISQVIREYRKTSYRVPMGILASRKHYCTNKNVCTKDNVDEECKSLLKDERLGCTEFKNANKIRNHPSVRKGGCYEIHDIEDLVKIGQTVKGCPYFASQSMAEEAQIVFCPYSYIINPIVRKAMDIDIKGSIVILDEAHNIEDIAREAGGVEVEEDILYTLQTEIGSLCKSEDSASIYQPLYDMVQGIIGWMVKRKMTLQKHEFEHYSSYWTADKALRELQDAGITQLSFSILQECATKAIKAALDAESTDDHLSGISAITLEGLFSSLSYLFSGNASHAADYQLALQRYVKRDSNNVTNGWVCKLSLWCLNPAVVFREIANLSLSIVLTSGTLSPMGSFASELGVHFETCMEAPHVINVESQLYAAVVPSGPTNCQLNASYKTADGYDFQDEVGASLEEILKMTPGGTLVFFPSYKLLEKLHLRWRYTGQWSRLNAQKPIFVEPRGNMDEFETVLRGYYGAIQGKTNFGNGKNKRLGLKHTSKRLTLKESSEIPVNRGAAFLAVFRGKVSEGIDFSDENARVVVIVGIPFPNKSDIQVVMKKKYNDAHKSSKGLLSGSEWYCHQAFRALNQAAGRCIRHRSDYGAIILLDERFKEERNLTYISKWLRNSIKKFDCFNDSLVGLKCFFQNAEVHYLQLFVIINLQLHTLPVCLVYRQKQFNSRASSSISEIEPSKCNLKENLVSSINFLNQDVQSKKNKKARKSNNDSTRKFIHGNEAEKAKFSMLMKHSGSLAVESSVISSVEDECTKEVYASDEKSLTTLNGLCNDVNFQCKDDSPTKCSEMSSASRELPEVDKLHRTMAPCDQLLQGPCFYFSTISNENLSGGACAFLTPQKLNSLDICNTSENEASLNMSVSSCNVKRRKLVNKQTHSCSLSDHYSFPDAESFCQVDFVSSRISTGADDISKPLFPSMYSSSECQKPGQRLSKNINKLPSDLSTKKLKINCLFCKSPLGLHDNGFLVNCSLNSSSKLYPAYVLEHGPSVNEHLDLHSTQKSNLPILTCEQSSLDHRILNSYSKGASSQCDFWSERDGCVFRTLMCPFCTATNTCLGMHIIATDASNLHLLNKVLFYVEHLDMNDEGTTNQERTIPISANIPGQGTQQFETEEYQYNSHPRTRISKLSLPKME